jgi:hypothetical protein
MRVTATSCSCYKCLALSLTVLTMGRWGWVICGSNIIYSVFLNWSAGGITSYPHDTQWHHAGLVRMTFMLHLNFALQLSSFLMSTIGTLCYTHWYFSILICCNWETKSFILHRLCALVFNFLLSLAPQPSLGLGLLHKIRLNFLEASQQFSFYRVGLLTVLCYSNVMGVSFLFTSSKCTEFVSHITICQILVFRLNDWLTNQSINSMESHSWETGPISWSWNSVALMEYLGSLLFPQELVTRPYLCQLDPVYNLAPYFL